MLLTHRAFLAENLERFSAGKSIAAKIAIMAITTSNSMRVNADLLGSENHTLTDSLLTAESLVFLTDSFTARLIEADKLKRAYPRQRPRVKAPCNAGNAGNAADAL